MADKSIGELVAATAVGSTDLFVLEQTGTAKKLTGQILENWLVSFADGHGGIQNISYTPPVSPSLVGTLTITLADTTVYTVNVTNGKGISTITDYWKASSSGSSVPSSWSTTRESMTSTNRYLWHYQTITYNDNTTLDTTKTVVGVYGDTGNSWYIWIKYAAEEPDSDADMGDTPDNWIGIYSGTASSAPTHYADYTWYGWQGTTGAAATLETNAVTYQASAGGTTIPTGTWTAEVPYVAPGEYLWTRVILEWNNGSPVTYYTVSRYGVDGQGSAGTQTPLVDNTNGSAGTSTSFSREDHQHPLPVAGDIVMQSGNTVENDLTTALSFEPLYITGTISSSQLYINDARIKSDMRVVECTFNAPANIASDLTWTTTNGAITFSGTVSASTTVYLILQKTN